MKIFALLLMLALGFPAWAEELEFFPGWKINKIEQAASEDGSYASGPEFYGLTPPDGRAAVSIDARTAKLLKTGEAQAEEVYGRNAPKNAKAETASAEDQYVYSAANNGFAQADEIASTLPGYQPQVAVAPVAPKRKTEGFGAAGSVASYGGSASSASGSGASTYPANDAGNLASNAGQASAYSPEATQTAASAREPASSANPNAEKNQIIDHGVQMVNASNTSNANAANAANAAKGANGSANRVGGRGLASDDAPPPPCNKGRTVYDKPTHVRVKLPAGCGLIHITAWGAGGGAGLQVYTSGGRDNTSQSVREIPGGGGSFMSTSWEIDARKYDLVVVVGETGGKAVRKAAPMSNSGGGNQAAQTQPVITFDGGDGGFPGGQDASRAGGGGGGYSGVFLVAKSDGSSPLNGNRALAIGAGGAGGNGGGAGGSVTVPSSAPDARMTNQIGEKAKGTKPGFYYYPERSGAGNPGGSGKVILEYF